MSNFVYKPNKSGLVNFNKSTLKKLLDSHDKYLVTLAKLQGTRIKFMSFTQPAVSPKLLIVNIDYPFEGTMYLDTLKDIQDLELGEDNCSACGAFFNLELHNYTCPECNCEN